jgi:hypothetical protein
LLGHSIKLGIGITAGLVLYLVNSDKAEAWTPCMPICDFACTAPAAINLSMQFLSSHLDLSQALMENINSISSLSSSMANRNASISVQESKSNLTRISAYDGIASKVSLTLQMNDIEKDFIQNNHLMQVEKLSKNWKAAEDAVHKTETMGKMKNDSLLNSMAASQTIGRNSDLMDDLLLGSDLFIQENNSFDDINEFREKSGLLADISHEAPNPFVTDEVDISFFMEYQKQLILLFNHNKGEPKDIYDATERLKSRLILNIMNFDILHNTSFESDGSIESLTMQSNATVARAKADLYRRLMLDKHALTSLETQTNGSLQLTNVIVKSQKNLLLQEILKVKKQKNMLLGLTMLGK